MALGNLGLRPIGDYDRSDASSPPSSSFFFFLIFFISRIDPDAERIGSRRFRRADSRIRLRPIYFISSISNVQIRILIVYTHTTFLCTESLTI